ncbi:MAG: hypothetical protein DI586_00695 [Micavibrio aeruginosavorus]|uniref:Uncharacterized protein n=1 Tax=Micavibrio aeruginosavorus TaxID=349221 RepID=A0A2W5HP39_9BACT|nr:MAG: hypothetical protein DI586_00695 [Micavibrio aeruginosavorus]
MALTNLKIPQSNDQADISEDDILELTDALPPHSDDFTSIADKAGRGEELSNEDFDSLKSAYIQKHPHDGKPSLLGRIATATRNLKNAALYKITGPAAPASETVIEHAPKQNLSERIANLTGKATGAVSATTAKIGTKTVDWTEKASYIKDEVLFAGYKGFVKTYDGAHKAFVEKPVTLASSTAAATKGVWSSLKSGVSAAASAVASGTASVNNSLSSRAQAVGQSLRDPEFRTKTWNAIKKATPEFLVQAAAGLPAGIAAKVLVTSSVGASFGTALAGGALASVIAGNVLKEYRKSKENEEKPELTGFFNKAAYFGKDMAKGAWFGIKHVAQGEFVWSLAREWKEDRNAILKRAAFGAVMGGIGWNIFGHEAASGIDTSHNDPTIIPDADADKVPFAPEAAHTSASAPVPVHVLSVEDAQALKDQAVTEYWHGDKAKGLEMFHEAAKAGNEQAIRDYQFLTGEKIAQTSAAPVSAPAIVEPSLKLDLSDIQNQASTEMPSTDNVTSSAFDAAFGAIGTPTTEQVVKGTVAVAGTGAAIALATPIVQSGVMAASIAISKPVEAPRAPAVAQMCKVIDKPNANGLVDLKCGTPRFEIMNPRDAIGFERQAAGEPTRIEYFVLDSQNSYRTLDIEESIVNDTKRFSDIVRKLRGQASGLFNQAASLLSGQPAAQNDNQPTELAQAPKIATGYDIK